MIGRRPNPRGISRRKVRRVFLGMLITPIIESVRIPARIRPYPTKRLFWGALSRHFVPGDDRTVPPGHFMPGIMRGQPDSPIDYHWL
jgi:hypothetical protein